MSDQPDVTQDQVFRTADAMAAEGLKPSVRLVRTQLGDRGSLTTVAKHLRTWREQRELEESGYLPPALLKLIAEHIRTITDQKTKDLTSRTQLAQADMEHLAACTEAAEKKAQVLGAELAGVREAFTRSLSQESDLEAKLQRSQDDARQMAAELRATLEKLARASAQAETNQATAEKADLRAEYLAQQLNDAQSTIEKIRASHAALEGQLATAQAGKAAVESRVDDLTRSLQQSTRSESDLNAALRHSLENVQGQLEIERQERKALAERFLALASQAATAKPARSRSTRSNPATK